MCNQFGLLAFHAGAQAVAIFELVGLLALAGSTQVGFVGGGGEGTSGGFTADTAFEQRTGQADVRSKMNLWVVRPSSSVLLLLALTVWTWGQVAV